MEHEALFTDDDRMPRIMPTLISGNDIECRGKNVDDFTFSFVAPLCADDDQVFHIKDVSCCLICCQKGQRNKRSSNKRRGAVTECDLRRLTNAKRQNLLPLLP